MCGSQTSESVHVRVVLQVNDQQVRSVKMGLPAPLEFADVSLLIDMTLLFDA